MKRSLAKFTINTQCCTVNLLVPVYNWCPVSNTDQDHDKDNQSEPEPIQPEIATEHLMDIKKSNLDDIKLSDLFPSCKTHGIKWDLY